MKMAKPSAKDIAAAEELQQVLNALDQNQRWGCAALEDTPDFFQLIDDDEFDPEQGRHAQALYNKLVTLMWENPSFHNRVISGMCHVIMYEKNEIIDPDSDCIDLHPRFAAMWNDLNRETQAARYWNKRYHQVVAERDEARAKLAAMESQEPYGLWSEERETMISEESAKAWPSETSWIRLYSKPVPADKPESMIDGQEDVDLESLTDQLHELIVKTPMGESPLWSAIYEVIEKNVAEKAV